jgi:hypothetical protein
VFLPAGPAMLRALHELGAAPGPLAGHAVTAAARSAWPDADDDELDYAVLLAAAYDSLVLLAAAGGGDPRASARAARRLVVVADTADDGVAPLGGEEPTAVVVTSGVALDEVAALYVDDPAAAPDVRAAARLVPAATDGDATALDAVALPDHELMWFAPSELADLLG